MTIPETIRFINGLLGERIEDISQYAFGYSYGKKPKDDSGQPIDVSVFVNNGLCHAFATLVKHQLPDAGLSLVGSPSHVFLFDGELYYDSANPDGVKEPPTRYPLPLLDYNTPGSIEKEFYNYGEALELLAFTTKLQVPLPDYSHKLKNLK
jgi:hypothetical protein